jgi:hypothetical protein
MQRANFRNICRAISLILLAVGLVLLVFMVKVEGEPGALPLALMLAGTVGSLASCRKPRRSYP